MDNKSHKHLLKQILQGKADSLHLKRELMKLSSTDAPQALRNFFDDQSLELNGYCPAINKGTGWSIGNQHNLTEDQFKTTCSGLDNVGISVLGIRVRRERIS